MTEISLEDWATALAAELGVTGDIDIDIEQILDLAGLAAHNVKRPAAPLTTFIVGLAAGKAGGSGQDITDALEIATAYCEREGDDD